MSRSQWYQRLCGWIFIISISLMAVTYYYKDKLPDPEEYDLNLLSAPIQETTTRAPFSINTNQYHYTITPKFDYELTGIVVTYSDADGFTNIWHHKRWKDFINIRDLCVIWEPNVSSGVYKHMNFTSDSWTCWASWESPEASHLFQSTALSNNHLLTDNDSIKTILKTVEKGDVIHLKGVLSAYKNHATNRERGTSITRNDHGMGACETVYLDEFEILKKANWQLRTLYTLSKWTALLSFIGFFIMVGMTPFKPR
ncbi:hypothetical protein [Legionella oakridgensis]|uniref:Uncharacterized protein n=2 Tax=Legionella oakridgensis TaxID=29423 RepID=W0B9H8_9GAMM|nr:hypothetical protein [Legionella oakridgensis]AHE66510.1 hypothetical protein Loa_00951 [Legionella oakridgensis ATCC 33761 = DSM 21215]KTD43923.1 hypothetical protein Loak_0473 [Legionella oakridgensis]STY19672.1 Uncharacterised protein [Legionella longbeachae]